MNIFKYNVNKMYDINIKLCFSGLALKELHSF